MPDLNESAEERITHENLEEEAHAVEPQADGDSDSLDADDSNPCERRHADCGRSAQRTTTAKASGRRRSVSGRSGDSGWRARVSGRFESAAKKPANTTDVVGTPEGDNEFKPNEPLAPLPEAAEEDPPGAAPDAYKGE